jgi:hypothetical protein
MNPPGSILDNPEHWHQRAEEARRVAEQLSDPLATKMMLRVAQDYEQLAEHALRRATGVDKKAPS